MTKEKFTLLKRTYPKSKIDRNCDGYEYLITEFTDNELVEKGINKSAIQKVIKKGEVYMYQVGVDEGKFMSKYFSLSNFEIIRKNIFIDKDE